MTRVNSPRTCGKRLCSFYRTPTGALREWRSRKSRSYEEWRIGGAGGSSFFPLCEALVLVLSRYFAPQQLLEGRISDLYTLGLNSQRVTLSCCQLYASTFQQPPSNAILMLVIASMSPTPLPQCRIEIASHTANLQSKSSLLHIKCRKESHFVSLSPIESAELVQNIAKPETHETQSSE